MSFDPTYKIAKSNRDPRICETFDPHQSCLVVWECGEVIWQRNATRKINKKCIQFTLRSKTHLPACVT